MVASPYDPQVHCAKKQSTIWIGDKIHLSETCGEGEPHLMTHVETTPAPIVDRDAPDDIHEALEAIGLLPDTHLVDARYVWADQLVARRKKGVRLLGPAPKDYPWQAQSGEGFTVQDVLLDWATGIRRSQPARQGTRARVGSPIATRDGQPSRFASRQQIVDPVLSTPIWQARLPDGLRHILPDEDRLPNRRGDHARVDVKY
jgi:hypothetical protein